MERPRTATTAGMLTQPTFRRQANCNRIANAPDSEGMKSSRRTDDFRDLLVSRGIRVTEQRLALLDAIARVTSPISHPELTERMEGSGLDRATVYRNLLTLAEVGVLVRTQLGDNVWRFELPRVTTSDHARHPHFVCNECGSVKCLPSNAVKLRGDATGGEVAEVQLRGRCTSCVAG